MEWVKKLHGKTVALDTSPLIFFIEQKEYLDSLDPFFEAVHRGEILIVTSVITLLEVLVQPLRTGNEELAEQYRDILINALNVKMFPVTSEDAQLAAELRAQHERLRVPDAIQLAIAINHQAEAFLTNDRKIPEVPGLELLVLCDLKTA